MTSNADIYFSLNAYHPATIPIWVATIIIFLSLVTLGLCLSIALSFRSSKRRTHQSRVFSVSGNPSASSTQSDTQSSAHGAGNSYSGSFGYVPLDEAPPSYEGAVLTAKPFWVPYSYLNSQTSLQDGTPSTVAEDQPESGASSC